MEQGLLRIVGFVLQLLQRLPRKTPSSLVSLLGNDNAVAGVIVARTRCLQSRLTGGDGDTEVFYRLFMRRNFYVIQPRLLTGGVLFHLLLAELGVLPDIVGHPANHVGAVEPLDASTREGETIFKGAHLLTELSFGGFKAVQIGRASCRERVRQYV